MADKAVGLGNLAGVKDWANGTFVKPGDAMATRGTIILTTSWEGDGPFTQAVTILGTTANSKIDLQPDAVVLASLVADGVTALWVENNNGACTAYALGAAPSAPLEVQYTRMEVAS